jgi:GGDEF domain-containing protein
VAESVAKCASCSGAVNMISLRTYLLGNSDGELESSYRRMINLFLQAISRHAVEGDKADYERFRSDMNAFAERFTPKLSIPGQFMVLGEALRALEDYNRNTSKSLRVQIAELRNMITALTQTVIVVGASNGTFVARLQEIEKVLKRPGTVEDIHLVNLQLGECLLHVRGEALLQKTEGKVSPDSFQQELAQSHERLDGWSLRTSLDLPMELPGKAEALKGLQEAAGAPGTKFLLLAVIDSLQAVNARFGPDIAEQVLAMATEHFRISLRAEDKLYQWQGIALLAVLGRTTSIDSIRAEVRRFADKKLEKVFVIGSRSVLLPICASWVIFPIIPPVDVLVRKIETFTAQVSPETANR